MNNRKIATISPVITNLIKEKDRHQLKLNLIPTEEIPEKAQKSIQKATHDLSVGDWVKKESGRPGVITDIKEVKPGYPSFFVKWSGDNHSTSGDRDSLTLIEDPKDKEWSIESEILKYLEKEKDFVHEVAVAAELEIGVPVARKYLRDLGDRVKNNGDRSWRIARPSDIDTDEVKEKRTLDVDVKCQHNFEFSPSPVKLGFVERCNDCGAVKSIQGSEKLSELISWLSLLVQDFESQAQNTKDEREQAYYLSCANNKQQLINQVNQFKQKAIDSEKERVLKLQGEIKELTRQFFVGVGDRLKEIISQKLYKSLGYKTSAVYCQQELGMTDRQARYLMAAAEVYHDLENRKSCSDFPLPTSEGQCRVLAKLPSCDRADFLREVAENNNGKIPSIRTLEKIVKQRKQPVSTSVKDEISQKELPRPKLEIVTKYGKPVAYNVRLTNPEIAIAFEKYISENGIASVDGAIARLLGLEDV